MPRNLSISRNEGEWLVDLLEAADPKVVGTWRVDLAAEIRVLFGMCLRTEEQANRERMKGQPTKTLQLNVTLFEDHAKT